MLRAYERKNVKKWKEWRARKLALRYLRSDDVTEIDTINSFIVGIEHVERVAQCHSALHLGCSPKRLEERICRLLSLLSKKFAAVAVLIVITLITFVHLARVSLTIAGRFLSVERQFAAKCLDEMMSCDTECGDEFERSGHAHFRVRLLACVRRVYRVSGAKMRLSGCSLELRAGPPIFDVLALGVKINWNTRSAILATSDSSQWRY
ncbi:hypothetical protein Tco_0814971 [Tanacetum coccineum]